MTITSPTLWLDGALVSKESTAISLMGHAAQRGSLVFDVCAFQTTAKGPALFRAHDHVGRFLRSSRIVGLELAFDEGTLVQAAASVVCESGLERGLVRWSAYLDAREPDLLPRETAAHVAVAAQALQDPPRRAPLRVALFDDARKASPDVLSPEAKVAGSYVGPMIARRRAVAVGADDVVLLDRDGDVAEAPIASVFAVAGGVLWTPPLRYVLPGITRDSVLSIARSQGIAVREERLPRDAFKAADEAFLTATSLPIGPIGQIDDRTLASAPGPITSRLIERLEAARRGDEFTEQRWLSFVR